MLLWSDDCILTIKVLAGLAGYNEIALHATLSLIFRSSMGFFDPFYKHGCNNDVDDYLRGSYFIYHQASWVYWRF